MKVIMLTGLVSVEKAQLTQDLARYFVQNKSVTVIDNIARLEIDDLPEHVQRQSITSDTASDFVMAITQILSSDVVIAAVSEQTHPEKLFVALDNLKEQQSEWEIYTLAMIDTRTCECFPNVRQALEMYADASLMMPYELDDVIHYVDTD